MASRSVDSNFVPAGARNRSWNWLTPLGGKDLAAEREPDDATTTPTVTTAYSRDQQASAPAPVAEAAPRADCGALDPVAPRAVRASRRDDGLPSSQTDSTGTSELERRNDAIMAKPTASDSGTKSDRDTPVMKNDGTNTATTDSIASSRGTTTSPLASSTAARDRRAARQVRVDVLDRDRRFVDEDADRQRQAAERHDVDRLTRAPERDDRRQQRERNRHDDDRRAAPVAQEQQHHQAGQQRAERRLAQHAPAATPRRSATDRARS